MGVLRHDGGRDCRRAAILPRGSRARPSGGRRGARLGARVQPRAIRGRVGGHLFRAWRSGQTDRSHATLLMLFGWFPTETSETLPVISSMAAAVRVTDAEQVRLWPTGTLGVGLIELPLDGVDASMEPARGHDGSVLWMSGEAFDWPSHGGLRGAADSRTPQFRSRLLDAILAQGAESIADLDGEYQIAVWRPQQRTLQLLNDRFGALPMYLGSSPRGTAFAGGVRGVVLGPGMSCEPDTQAIREAVSFGGYRLGSRTNIRDVRMMPPASVVTISPAGTSTKRYWTWSELRDGDATNEQEFLEEARARWRAAIATRLDGARRPGLTLSGGLDSEDCEARRARGQCGVGTVSALRGRMAGAAHEPHSRDRRADGSRRPDAHGSASETSIGFRRVLERLHRRCGCGIDALLRQPSRGFSGHDAVLRRLAGLLLRRRAPHGGGDDRRHARGTAVRSIRAEAAAVDQSDYGRGAPVRDRPSSVRRLPLL
ncbi:MAG: hypothetical protein DMF88_11880 [Acidobacteria bacterium]|nr:MAG: hypothetical protein DMF88_11880 [Acidobacteriota bacterium]